MKHNETQELQIENSTADSSHGGLLYTPRVDITENENELTLVADLPGVEPGGVDVQYENEELTLYGKVIPRHERIESLYSEYRLGDFQRTFRVSAEIDAENITAALNNGVLRIRLPKSEAVKPRKIEIKAN